MNPSLPKTERPCLYFTTGILANLRLLIGDAIAIGDRYGYDVRILDLIDLVPEWQPYPNPWQALGLADHVFRPADTAALDRFCEEQIKTGDVFLFLHLPERDVLDMWRRLERTPAAVGVMTVSPVPIRFPAETSITARLEARARRILRPVKALLKPRPDLWVMSGHESIPTYRSFFRDTSRTLFVKAHSLDYEYSRPFLRLPRSEKTILFLDQGWFSKLQANFNTDGKYPPTQYAAYQRSIVRFLRDFESASDWRVVVSAHPKAKLEDTRALYQGLTVTETPTAELARDAAVVVGNCSTSLQYGVIFEKPVLLFSSNELDQSIMYPGVAGYHSVLGSPIVNIDEAQNYQSLIASIGIDRKRYAAFLRDYVDAAGGSTDSIWDKVFSQISSTRAVAA